MRQYFRWITRSVVAVAAGSLSLLSLSSGTAWANDAPSRVARLAEFSGEVRLANDYEDWQSISRNYPITHGDNVWVSDGGRAEIDVGAFQLWASGGANAYFERFDDHNLVVRLNAGAMAVRIRNWEAQDAMRIQTQDGEVVFNRPGFYLIDSGNGDFGYRGGGSLLSVNSGQAEVLTANNRQWVDRGSTVVFDRYGVRFDRYVSGQGGFESWAQARSNRYDSWANSSDYGDNYAPWMVGVSALDDYGRWDRNNQYGRVWYPTSVSSDWAPYRDGRWVWVRPWGWTWVDNAPWGFAPSHYGRWVRIGHRWAWAPGSYASRPVYAPALVTFFGGNGWSVSVNVGSPAYSWVPLGWGEPYAPWYSYSPNYWRGMNRPYVRNWAEAPWRPSTYVNAGYRDAITVVPSAVFTGGRPVRDNYVRNIRERDLRGAPPAQVSELVPQFRAPNRDVITSGRGAPPAIMRSNDPNPVVRGQSVQLPSVRQSVPQNTNPGFSAPAQPMPKRPGSTDFINEPQRGTGPSISAPVRADSPQPPATMPDRGIPRPPLAQPQQPRTLYTEQPQQPQRPQIQEMRPEIQRGQQPMQPAAPRPQPVAPVVREAPPQRGAAPNQPQPVQQFRPAQPVQQAQPQVQMQAPQRPQVMQAPQVQQRPEPRPQRGNEPMEKRQ